MGVLTYDRNGTVMIGGFNFLFLEHFHMVVWCSSIFKVSLALRTYLVIWSLKLCLVKTNELTSLLLSGKGLSVLSWSFSQHGQRQTQSSTKWRLRKQAVIYSQWAANRIFFLCMYAVLQRVHPHALWLPRRSHLNCLLIYEMPQLHSHYTTQMKLNAFFLHVFFLFWYSS